MGRGRFFGVRWGSWEEQPESFDVGSSGEGGADHWRRKFIQDTGDVQQSTDPLSEKNRGFLCTKCGYPNPPERKNFCAICGAVNRPESSRQPHYSDLEKKLCPNPDCYNINIGDGGFCDACGYDTNSPKEPDFGQQSHRDSGRWDKKERQWKSGDTIKDDEFTDQQVEGGTDQKKEAEKLFGLTPPYTQADVKGAFKRLARIHHPDVEGGDEETFKKINELRNFLMERL